MIFDAARWVSDRIKVCGAGTTPKEIDPVQQYVAKQMGAFRVGRINLAYGIIAFLLIGYIILPCVRILLLEKRVRNTQQDILVLVAAFASLLPKHCSWLEPGKAVHVSYGLAIAFCMAYVQMSDDAVRLICFGQMSFIRLAFTPCGLHILEVAFWNALCTSANVIKYIGVSADDQAVIYIGSYTVVVLEMIVFTLILAASEWFRMLAWSEVFRDALAKSDGLHYDAHEVLMDNVCDVTLQLDDDFALSSDSKRFAALLMRDTTRSLKGTNIQEFMPFEHDKERFCNMFAHKDNQDRHAVTCLNLHLRESGGTDINVEIFGVRFKSFAGVPNYILGIREIADERWMAPIREVEQANGQRKQKRTSRNLAANSNPSATVLGSSSNSQPVPCTQSGSSDSLSETPSTSTSSKDKNDARQHRQPTGNGAKLQSMAEVIATWSVIPAGKTCCAYHASLDEAKNVARMMRRGPCQPAFYDDDLLQCGACGILNDPNENRQCTLCEGDLAASTLAL
eukprot:TRINITY_DN158_c1_g1_i5.p1 TRINITY_DN158_c1_g1~~TRINITY_DN158_c1_g1_i5.p1  ORF type:complete len:556 (-),score=57.04 TRINITY_DN158_c1_g1_i5:1052-2578(-)